MLRDSLKFIPLFLTVLFLLTGCATTRARQTPASAEAQEIAQLQAQVQAKDQQIMEMQQALNKYEQSISNSYDSTGSLKGGKSVLIQVTGVSVLDVQRALLRAGYDPGPTDGRAGKKTKKAIKAFQRNHGLYPDAVVGEKTWTLLNK